MLRVYKLSEFLEEAKEPIAATIVEAAFSVYLQLTARWKREESVVLLYEKKLASISEYFSNPRKVKQKARQFVWRLRKKAQVIWGKYVE